MTSAQVVETSVNVISNSPSQDYTHPDDGTSLYDCCVIVCKIAVADCRAFGFPPNLSNLLSQMQLKSPPKMFSSVAERKLESVAK